jgi:hypothetical protein
MNALIACDIRGEPRFSGDEPRSRSIAGHKKTRRS